MRLLLSRHSSRHSFMSAPVCACKMLAAAGWGMGEVGARGHGVRLDKWIAAHLWSLA